MSDIRPRLEVYMNQSILFQKDKTPESFREGNPSEEAKKRLQLIKDELEKGYLVGIINSVQNCETKKFEINSDHADLILHLVDSVTSEVGRALVGLTILQLCVKAISPEQSIRLHKSGGGGSNFSWEEGVPMRVLDKNYITPVLREYDLLKLNADGFMMTRSLAENYPYSKVYKAAIRGAREEWLELVDLVEANLIEPQSALRYLILLLFNRSEAFVESAQNTMRAIHEYLPNIDSLEIAIDFLKTFIENSPYSARLFEIALHSLFQVLEDSKVFGGALKPLCQMRSANKKHGNIGDIEIIKKIGGLEILEAWDAKYGKNYLRDELDEISDKLYDHSETELVGFVVDNIPLRKKEIEDRIQEIQEIHNVKIVIVSFEEWVRMQVARLSKLNEPEIAKKWIIAFSESLCQMRRTRAPIDEPSEAWVDALGKYCASE